jgi:polyhydroxyalkanoate synthesis regulator phasin
MAWTAAETARVEAIEKQLNKVQIAIKNLASQQQVRSLSTLKQKEVDELKARVSALEAQLAILQDK